MTLDFRSSNFYHRGHLDQRRFHAHDNQLEWNWVEQTEQLYLVYLLLWYEWGRITKIQLYLRIGHVIEEHQRKVRVHSQPQNAFSIFLRISQVAAEFGHPSIVEALLQHGAQVDGQNAKGRATALMLSAKCGHSGVLDKLLSHRATVDLRDVKGRQALHHAALGGHHLVAKSLLRASAEVCCHDTCGRTPLHLATLALNETWWTVGVFPNPLMRKFICVFACWSCNPISSKEWSNEVWCPICQSHEEEENFSRRLRLRRKVVEIAMFTSPSHSPWKDANTGNRSNFQASSLRGEIFPGCQSCAGTWCYIWEDWVLGGFTFTVGTNSTGCICRCRWTGRLRQISPGLCNTKHEGNTNSSGAEESKQWRKKEGMFCLCSLLAKFRGNM